MNVQRQEKGEWIIDAVLTDNKDNEDLLNLLCFSLLFLSPFFFF